MMNGLPAPDRVSSAGPVELIMSEIPADPSPASAVRRALSAWLEVTAFDATRIGDIGLAVYEAMANAIEHGYNAGATGTMTVRAAYSTVERALQIAVADSGRWQTPANNPLRGNGFPLIAALTNDAYVERSEAGTMVLMNWVVDSIEEQNRIDDNDTSDN